MFHKRLFGLDDLGNYPYYIFLEFVLQCYFKVIYLVTSCRNYHVFYYLLAGASPEVKEELHLTKPEEYCYLNQVFLHFS